MGGNVEVHSDGIGKGTTFTIKMRAITKVDSNQQFEDKRSLCAEEVKANEKQTKYFKKALRKASKKPSDELCNFINKTL